VPLDPRRRSGESALLPGRNTQDHCREMHCHLDLACTLHNKCCRDFRARSANADAAERTYSAPVDVVHVAFLTAAEPRLLGLGHNPGNIGACCGVNFYWMRMMIDQQLARLRAHRSNIQRYRNLLQTNLSELERQFVEKRLIEEQSNLDSVANSPSPMT
jgi:hypothetical protein